MIARWAEDDEHTRAVGLHADAAPAARAARALPAHGRDRRARHRAGRRRRLRLKIGVYPEDIVAALARHGHGRPVKWIEDRTRGLPVDDPRPRPDPGGRARGDRRGEDHRDPRPHDRGVGAYLQRTAGTPVLGGWLYAGAYDIPAYSLQMHAASSRDDADRRLPRRRPAGGDVRDRARGRCARAQARPGSRSSCGGGT